MPPDPDPLDALLAAARGGDRAAVDRLLTRLRPYLHAVVRARLGPHPDPRVDPSSVVQLALAKVADRHHQVARPGVPAFLGWAGAVARTAVADKFRELARLPAQYGSDGGQGVPAADPSSGPDDRSVAVAAAVARLPDRYRAVIELSFLDELSDAEIGEQVGVTPGHVRVLRYRALNTLRADLGVGPPEDRP